MLYRTTFFIPWVLGFFTVFNLYLVPSLERSPRVTDALGAALGLWLFWRFATTGLCAKLLFAFFVSGVIPFLWSLYALFVGDILSVVSGARWLLAIPWAFVLFDIARHPQQRISMVWGLWWGCVANAGVLLLQDYGFVELTKNLGLASQDSLLGIETFGQDRNSGMHGHPNGSAAIVSLIIPTSLYLYYVGKTRAWTIIVALGVLASATQFTLTRSSLLTSLATILTVFVVFFIVSPSMRRSLRLVVLVALIVLPAVYWFGLPGGVERWQNSTRIESNTGERLLSNAVALQISLESPLGLGVNAGEEAMRGEVGTRAAHNAFLGVALVYGPLLAGLLALLIFFLSLQILRGLKTTWMLEAILALHLFGLFLWEQFLMNPTFMILANWLVAASMSCTVASLRRRSTIRQRRTERAFPITSTL